MLMSMNKKFVLMNKKFVLLYLREQKQLGEGVMEISASLEACASE